jgi:hypothetical protein
MGDKIGFALVAFIHLVFFRYLELLEINGKTKQGEVFACFCIVTYFTFFLGRKLFFKGSCRIFPYFCKL